MFSVTLQSTLEHCDEIIASCDESHEAEVDSQVTADMTGKFTTSSATKAPLPADTSSSLSKSLLRYQAEKRRQSEEYQLLIKDVEQTVGNYDGFKLEKELEKKFIQHLKDLGYSQIELQGDQLWEHMRVRLEQLHAKRLGLESNYRFRDAYWELVTRTLKKMSTQELTRMLVLDEQLGFSQDASSGLGFAIGEKDTPANLFFYDTYNFEHNQFEVTSQVPFNDGEQRTDVSVLINGIPVVHIELKKASEPLMEAFQQIARYNKDAFAGTPYAMTLAYVVSNGVLTRYYSNSVQEQFAKEKKNEQGTSSDVASFEMTNVWATEDSCVLNTLPLFTQSFFKRDTLFELLLKFSTITNTAEDRKNHESAFLLMRPYQYYAAKKVIQRIHETDEGKRKAASPEACGYLWHTTGSGKTFTSFTIADLVSRGYRGLNNARNTENTVVLLVVDRKELRKQTVDEFTKFSRDERSFDTQNTDDLRQALSSSANELRVTTIQKLNILLTQLNDELARGSEAQKQQAHTLLNKRMIIIVDECHRTQNGSMHWMIRNSFKNYNLFGLTGTPRVRINGTIVVKPYSDPESVDEDLDEGSDANQSAQACDDVSQDESQSSPEKVEQYTLAKDFTTKELFGKELHKYNIVDALLAGTVLPFKITYAKDELSPEQQEELQKLSEELELSKGQADALTYEHDGRIAFITEHILNSYHRLTHRDITRPQCKQRENGFNGMFTVSSIDQAKRYYDEFKTQIEKHAKIAQDIEENHPEKLNSREYLLSKAISELVVTTVFSQVPISNFTDSEADKSDVLTVTSEEGQTGKGSAVYLPPTKEISLEDDEELDATSKIRDLDTRKFLEKVWNKYSEDLKCAEERESKDNGLTGSSAQAISFDNYVSFYNSIAKNFAERKIDLLIVVNMFLTGYDSKTLNTLWVDRTLQMQGLIQAFSRTNRLYNSTKKYGHIVCYRDLKENIEQAVAHYASDGIKSDVISMRSWKHALDDFTEAHEEFKAFLDFTNILDMQRVDSEEQANDFAKLFYKLMSTLRELKTYAEYQAEYVLKNQEPLPQRDLNVYQSIYNNSVRPFTAKNKSDRNKDQVKISIYRVPELQQEFILGYSEILSLLHRLFGATGALLKKKQFDELMYALEADKERYLLGKILKEASNLMYPDAMKNNIYDALAQLEQEGFKFSADDLQKIKDSGSLDGLDPKTRAHFLTQFGRHYIKVHELPKLCEEFGLDVTRTSQVVQSKAELLYSWIKKERLGLFKSMAIADTPTETVLAEVEKLRDTYSSFEGM